MAYAYNRTLAIPAQSGLSGDLTDFPVTVVMTLNNAHVLNANGYDVVIGPNSDGSSHRAMELEDYNSSTGVWVGHFKEPTISKTVSENLIVAYGDGSVSVNPSSTACWNANYTFVMHLNGSGPSVTDSSGHLAGTNHSATATTGQIDGGAAFNGSSQSVSLGYSSILNLSGSVTVSAWVNRPSTSTGTVLGHMVTPPINQKTQYCFLTNGSGASMLYSDASNAFHEYDVTSGLSTNTWQYLVWTITWGTGSSMKTYIDSVLASGSWTSGSGNGSVDGSSTEDAYIGHLDHPTAPLWFSGSMDEVRLSAVALSQDWITTEFNNQSAPGSFYTLGTETAVGGDTLFAQIWM